MTDKQAPYRPGHGGYVSEFTQFIDGFMLDHPEVQQSQRRGWYIYWDRMVDLADARRAAKDTVPLPPYYYE